MRFLKALMMICDLFVCVCSVLKLSESSSNAKDNLRGNRSSARAVFDAAPLTNCKTSHERWKVKWNVEYTILFLNFKQHEQQKQKKKKSFMNIILLGVLVFAACQRKNVNGMCENLGETFNRIDSNWILFRSHAWVCVCDECAEWTRYAEVRRTGQSGSPTCLRNIFCA